MTGGARSPRDATRERMKRWREANRDHVKAYQKAWREKNASAVAEYQKQYSVDYRKRPDAEGKAKERHLWNHYRLKPHEFNSLWEKQSGKCAICENQMLPKGRAPLSVAVDHNHETGEVRGLLCKTCNAGIGQLWDDPDILMRAAEYLIERGFYSFRNIKD
jgi:hypothetical protein